MGSLYSRFFVRLGDYWLLCKAFSIPFRSIISMDQQKVFRFFFVGLIAMVLALPEAGFAASKKRGNKAKQPGIPKSQVNTTAVTVSGKEFRISCFRGVAGTTKKLAAKGRVEFQSYRSILAKLKKQGAKKKTLQRYKSLNEQGNQACASASGPGATPTPVPTPTPAYLSLEPYTGAFGESEARVLYDRFSFGGRPEEISAAVQAGLINTVVGLTTPVDEPAIDAVEAELRCDGRLASDPQNAACDTANPNDLYLPGYRYGIYYRMLHTQRPFFEKLFMFLHDERLSASTSALDYSDQHAINNHVAMLRRAARSGDYIQYMRDWNRDVMGHFKWLDGASNKSTGPNENYAREFWELGTVGPTDLNGAPVYNDHDIAQAALAFTGWSMEGYDVNGHWVSYPGYVPAFHAVGPFTIFGGTPYAALVNNDEDVLQATFRHPRTAESLAQDIWKEFINPNPTADAIRSLADIIRNNNYNLIATLRQVMISKAMFAPESRRSLIKHPVEKLIGFLRLSQIPLDYQAIDWILSDMGQRPLLPDTVFGWDEKKLSGEAYILEWRNAVLWILTHDEDEWLQEYGYNFHDFFLNSVPVGIQPSQNLMGQLSARFNVPFNGNQIPTFLRYLDYNLEYCYNPEDCGGSEYRISRDVFDPDLGSQNWNYKLRGALLLTMMMPEFGIK